MDGPHKVVVLSLECKSKNKALGRCNKNFTDEYVRRYLP